ncbi:MAG: tRNA pseudouridine(55) synthase TruB [Phycisphaerales bacterium JB037]
MTDTPPITGLLNIDKPLGWSSMKVCAHIRAKLRRAGAPKRIKVGHGGTLDPLATGVLVVLVGRATKLCDQIMQGEKEYRATIDLSRTSDTDDLEGPVHDAPITTIPTADDITAACAPFIGTIQQTPPAYSAIKVDGKRAYALARAGDAPQLSPRPVTIHAIELEHYEWPEATLRVRSGKGVYLRSLARDLGRALNTGGMLTALVRTRIADFTLEYAIKPDDLPDPLPPESLQQIPEDLA